MREYVNEAYEVVVPNLHDMWLGGSDLKLHRLDWAGEVDGHGRWCVRYRDEAIPLAMGRAVNYLTAKRIVWADIQGRIDDFWERKMNS